MKFTQTAPRIKLIVVEEEENDYKEKLKWLAYVANDLRNLRNDVTRECVSYLQKQINKEELPKDKKGKKLSYATFAAKKRKNYEHASKTLIWGVEWQTVQKFSKSKKNVLSGKANIPMFRDLSILIGNQSKIWKNEDDRYFLAPVSMNKISFEMINVHKDKTIRTILDRVISKEYKFGDSQIIRDGKFWYLYLSYTFDKEPDNTLDFDKICGVDLGWKIPAVCGLIKGLQRAYLGDSEHLQRFKTQIKGRRRKIQKSRNDMKEGHGKKRALKALNKLQNKEANFVETFNHKISKQVIDFCLENNAGTIHLEALTKEVKKNKFLTAYWSYYQLQTMIEYKAVREGIKVLYINPAYTSQTCSGCGHIAKENRVSQAEFICHECGLTLNADYNASLNIARSREFVGMNDLENSVEVV